MLTYDTLITAFWLYVVAADSLLALWLYRGWRDRNKWYDHCRNVDFWRDHFKQNVSGNWIFNDGQGR